MSPAAVTASFGSSSAAVLVLVQRRGLQPLPGPAPGLRLALTADQRTSLRGRRRCVCGRDLVLQLPRGAALQPGEVLASADGKEQVLVEAAPEPLLRVCSDDPRALLQAAYHLGNRHVALAIEPGSLLLLQDPVLEQLLRQRNLAVQHLEAPFRPEAGAYGGASHSHSHSHGPSPSHGHGADPRSDDRAGQR